MKCAAELRKCAELRSCATQSRGGHPGLPSLINLVSVDVKQHFNHQHQELCETTVEVDVLGSQSLIYSMWT